MYRANRSTTLLSNHSISNLPLPSSPLVGPGPFRLKHDTQFTGAIRWVLAVSFDLKCRGTLAVSIPRIGGLI